MGGSFRDPAFSLVRIGPEPQGGGAPATPCVAPIASVPSGRSSRAVAPPGLLVVRCAAAPSAPARTTFRDHAPVA
eukprot:80369-Alexandrium_andersonii.AAC.1